MRTVYLPREKLLVNADLNSPLTPGQHPAAPAPGMLTLYQNIRQLKLDASRHVPIHGRVGTNYDFLKAAGQTQ